MKKFFALLLSICIVIALCACAASDEDVKGDIENSEASSAEEAAVESEDAAESSEYEASEASEAEDAELESAEEESSEEDSYEISMMVGGTYTNQYFGFGCTLDDSWAFLSEEEILAANELSGEYIGEELQEAIANADILYELSATKNEGLESIGVNIENAGVAALAFTEENYLKAQQDALKTALENAGFTDVSVEVKQIEFAGAQRWAFDITGDVNGTLFQEVVVTIKHGTRFANITAATYNENLDALLENFYTVE